MKCLALLGAAALAVATSYAQQDPNKALLDALVKKGILTNDEAAGISKEVAAAGTSDKITLATPTESLRISGDIRIRAENRTAVTPAGDHVELDRYRYRLRLGLLGKVADGWSYGLRLDTNSNSRSSNVTFGTNNATGFGPWSKGDDGVFVNQVYVSYAPTPALTLTAGRMPLPLTTTNLVWYQDYSPEGLSEQYKATVGSVDYKVNLAQFMYGSPGFNNSLGTSANGKNLLMLAWQAGVKYNINKTDYVQVSPVFYNYANTDVVKNPTPFNGLFSPTNLQAANNLAVLEVPLEYSTARFGSKPLRFFADAAVNFDAGKRATGWGRPDLSGSKYAYQAGLQYGKAAKKGEWDTKAYWQATDMFAVDPNLIDPDLFDSLVNLKGWVLTGNYYLGNSTLITSTVASASRIDPSVTTAGFSQDTKNFGAALKRYWLYQMDLTLKF